MVICNECHARMIRGAEEVYNNTDKECAHVCGCQEHMEKTTEKDF